MKTTSKLILAVVSFVPLIYIVLFVVNFFSFESGGIIDFDLLFNLHLVFMLWIIGLMIYYIIHIFQSQKLASDRRILWTIIIFFGHVIAIPFYWYSEIWKEPKLDQKEVEEK